MLEIRNLTKSYRNKKALNSVSMKLENGLYGLLGPNGAGKSTLMNIITDNLSPDSGEVLWDGEPAVRLGKNFRIILGYMPQQQGLYENFTAKRFLSYIAALKCIPKKQLSEEIERVAALVNLTDEMDKKLSAYSGGMRQRILIAQAILGDPKLLILDEPTAGLDPKERVRMRNLVSNLAKDRIVLLATHVVSDIETIASEIILLKSGVMVKKAPPAELLDEFAPHGTIEDVYMKIFDQSEVV
jgi:ABC-2 type transport system ATP-binding protein